MKKILISVLVIVMMCSLSIMVGCNDKENKEQSSSEVIDQNTCNHQYEVINTVDATCLKPMEKTYKCKICGKTYTETVGKELGHTGEWEVVKEPTCTEDGLKQRTCTRCGVVEKVTLPMSGHKYQEDESLRVEPTCTENGKKVLKCSVCGEQSEIAIPAVGHTPEGEGVVVAPTCTEDGYTEYTCKVCGKTYKDNIVKATGHNMQEAGDIEQTCEHGAGKKYVCQNGCGHTEFVYTGERLPHNFDKDGKCSICHKQIFDMNYITLSDESYIRNNVEGKKGEWIYNYKDGEMNEAPKFDLIIEKDYVNAFLALGCEGISFTIERKSPNHATYININGKDGKNAVTVYLPFKKDTAVSVEQVVVSNDPETVASDEKWVAADGFKLKTTLNYAFNKDNPESYIFTDSPYTYNTTDLCYNGYYLNNYPIGCKFEIKKAYLDMLREQGIKKINVKVTSSGTPGIDKDDATGTTCGTRAAGIAQATFDIVTDDKTLFVDGNLVLRVYANMETDLSVYISYDKPFDINDKQNYVTGEVPYVYNESENYYQCEYKDTYPHNTRLKIRKDYLDYLKEQGFTKLNIKVTGLGKPGIDKDDAAGTVCGTRTPDSGNGVPDGLADATFDLNSSDKVLFTKDGDLIVRIYTSKSSTLKVTLTPQK